MNRHPDLMIVVREVVGRNEEYAVVESFQHTEHYLFVKPGSIVKSNEMYALRKIFDERLIDQSTAGHVFEIDE
jgi:hypothetical protein